MVTHTAIDTTVWIRTRQLANDLPGLRRDRGDVLRARYHVSFHHGIEHFRFARVRLFDNRRRSEWWWQVAVSSSDRRKSGRLRCAEHRLLSYSIVSYRHDRRRRLLLVLPCAVCVTSCTLSTRRRRLAVITNLFIFFLKRPEALLFERPKGLSKYV
jgi:hypothetical protein